jgi:hypothetical protein
VSRRAGIRKRERQKQRHAQRPQQVEKPVGRIKTAGLFGAILERSRAFDEALKEVQLPTNN